MDCEQKIKTLQLLYAAALADSVLRYGTFGVLDRVAEQKRTEQMKNGAALAGRFGVREPADAFVKIADICGCADWQCEKTETGLTARTSNCTLCAAARKMGTCSPCDIHCLTPLEAMVKAVAPGARFETQGTLWQEDCCAVIVTMK